MKLFQGDVSIISEVDAKNMRVRVEMGASGVVSPWLMFISPLFYYMPRENDQVVCFYDEYRRQGVAFGLARKEGDVPFGDADIVGLDLGKCVIEISRSTGKISVTTDEAVTVKAKSVKIEASEVEITEKLTVGGAASFKDDVSASKKITATGVIESTTDVKSLGISLTKHLHPTSQPGAPTMPPTATP